MQAEDPRQVLPLLADYGRMLDEGRFDELLDLYARSDYLFFEEDLRLVSAGTYEDEFVRKSAGWRFARRRVESGLRAPG